MPSESAAMERFYEHILPWVRENGVPDAAKVTSVESYGTDWDGDTEGGFYSKFEVTIRGQRENGQSFWNDYQGEDLMSLWKWTVREVFGD